MPNIHGSLTNDDFIKGNEIAKELNVKFPDWVSSVVIAEIHKLKPTAVKA